MSNYDTHLDVLTPPSSINDVRTQAHLAIGQRLINHLDLTTVLDYVITNVDQSVLPFLTWQFDMQSSFWQLLSPGASQSQLIQQSISLHKYNGTVYAIQQVLANLNFPGATVQEGQNSWGGSSWPSNQGWAVFRVVIPIPSFPITIPIQSQLIAAITFFKPARCWLDSVQWVNNLVDIIPANQLKDRVSYVAAGAVTDIVYPYVYDIVGAMFGGLVDLKTVTPTHNGHFYHAGLNYGTSNPAVVDSGIVANGTPQY